MSRKFMSSLLAACAVAVAPTASAAPILRNAGFESGAENSADAWNKATPPYSFVSGGGRNGTRALFFDRKEGSPYAFPSQVVPVTPGKRYRAAAWVRCEDVTGDGAAIAVEWRMKDGSWGGGVYSQSIKNTSGRFVRVEVIANIPKDVGKCTLSAFARPNTRGRVWFDDLELAEVEKPLLGALVTDVYRNTAASGDVTLSTVVNLTDEEAKRRGLTAEYLLPGKGGCKAVPVPIAGGAARLKLDVCRSPVGTHQFGFRIVDADGRTVADRKTSFTRVASPDDLRQPVRIERNRTLVNGKPFFPLGVFASPVTPEILAEVKKGAFNCMMSYNQPTRDQLDLAHKEGIKVIYCIKHAYLGTSGCPKAITDLESEREWVEEQVLKYKDHPALLAWYINDELGFEFVERLIERKELVQKLDPGHPTYVALYQMDILPCYLGSFDVIGSDPYPICQSGNPPISQVAEHTRITRNTVFGGMPMWQIPQLFDWGAYRKADVKKTRAPTFEEMRNMQWQFIAEGAMGLVPYSYNALLKMEWRDPAAAQWKKACDISREMAGYTSVFLSEEPTVAVAGVPAGVSARQWHYRGRDYLLFVNTTRESVDFEADVELHGKVRVALAPIGVEMRVLAPPQLTEPRTGDLIAAEQRSKTIVAFDGRTPGPHPYAWEWSASRDPNMAREDAELFKCPAECKCIREADGVHVLMADSACGFADISFATGRTVAYGMAAPTPHSIAKLPGKATYVVASAVSNCLTVVDCSAHPFEPKKQKCRVFPFFDAHGVEWDAARNCLWALGEEEIARYRWNADDFELVKDRAYPLARVGERAGHDLAPDGKGGYLISASKSILHFDPNTETLGVVRNESKIKSISPSPKCGEALAKVREVWWTDRILVRRDGREYAVGPFPGARFYKARWMNGGKK